MPRIPTDWPRLEAVLDELLDAPPADRAPLLGRLKREDVQLAQRAQALLALALDNAVLPDSLGVAAPELFTALAEEDVRAHVGERLGPYRVVEMISRGGMGVVFRGERADGAFEQRVAIKLVPVSIAGETARALLERERHYLARLEHPNIARIIDAGVTVQNTPYYVMEYVDGISIDDCVRDQRASRRQALGYFLQLCEAVAYCHRSMVVHGDIKPGNVLVADNRVRLVDFGIGQLLEDGTDNPETDRVHAFSPGFSAPEQQRGEAATIQSDIYSLGAVLDALFAPGVAADGGRGPSRDIAAIVDCCLAEDPADRYDSVSALRADVRNHLGGYVVSARQLTRRYRASRFVRRNKLLVGATATALLSLGIGLAVAVHQYQSARQQATRAERVKNFLTSLFEQANPVVAGERETTLRHIVDDAAARLHTELNDFPKVRAELSLLLGNAYFGIGDYDKALQLHRQTLALWRADSAAPGIRVVEALNALGTDHTKRGDYAQAEALHREAIDLLDELGLSGTVAATDSWTGLGASLVQTDPRRAREAMLHAHEINLRLRPGDLGALARSLGNVAAGYRAERDIEQSANYHEQALAMAETNNERLAPEILTIRCNLALDYGTLGRHEHALEAQHICNELTVQRFGPDHPANVSNLNNLGALDIRLGRLSSAGQTYREALRVAEEKLPSMSLERMAVEINYSVVLWHSGDSGAAEARLRDLLARMERSVGAEHAASGRVRSLLGRVILESGDAPKAKRFIESSLQGLLPYWRSDALLWLAEANLALGDEAQAAVQAAESLELRRSIPHFTGWQVAEAEHVLALASDDRSMQERAAQVLASRLPAIHFRRRGL